MSRRFRLDRTARRLAGGEVLLAGSPLTWFRLGPAGRRALDAIERGDGVPPGADPLVDRLLDTGAAHPVVEPGGGGPDDRLTAVVPAHGPVPPELLDALRASCARTVVVDDATCPPLTAPGATIVRHATNTGPAGARMTGLAEVATPYVAFVDLDTAPAPRALACLVAHLDADPRVALVAPRVASPAAPGGTALARYEAVRSPLDLGPDPARIAALTRVSYVPAAALVARTAALREVGFDPALRVGEDVDLVWRLAAAGWRCRYEPAAVVHHRPRATVSAALRQRMAYGAAAGPLGRRHPRAVTPVVASPLSGAGWALALAGHPVLGAAAGLATAVPLARRLPRVGERARLALRLSLEGHVRTGLHLGSALTRAWWPLTVSVALVRPRRRRTLATVILGLGLAEWVQRRPALDPARYVALRIADDVAYGAGVWRGAWSARTITPLRPRRPGSLAR